MNARSLSIGGHDARGDGYISTTAAYFQNGETRTEAERLLKFEEARKAVYETDPTDRDAQASYALALIATAGPADKAYVKQLEAGALGEEVLNAVPEHLGAQHYIIHAYDAPGLAQRALPVSRRYGVEAAKVPHALHMMSHIFTRLGLWDESIKWYLRSKDAA